MAPKKIKPLTGKMGDFSGIVLKAAARGDLKAVKHYLKHEPAWLNQEGPHGRTMLWEAAYKGRTELVAELIAMGADVNPVGGYYTPMLVELSALAVARNAQHDALCELLIKHGAVDDLYAASHRGDLEAINTFLTDDPDAVNRPVRDEPPHPRVGYLPVHYAVAGQQLGALRLLAGYGAKFDLNFPLLLDWASGNREIVRYLRGLPTAQTKPKSRSKSESTKAKSKKPKPNVPPIDRPDWMGFPLLVDACRGNHNATDDPKRVKKLLDRGANVNITDHKEKTPLHRAAQAGFIDITKLLLKSGASLETPDATGATPLFEAAFYGREETLELLIKKKANLEHTDKRGETPLFAAARGSRPETFRVLLDAGVDRTRQNNRGQTVEGFIHAMRRISDGRAEILRLLAKKN